MTKQKILMVDDDLDLVRAVARKLRSRGFEVTVAQDGLTAVSEARKQRPDLVLLDLGLPAGDGFTTLGRIRGLLPLSDVPVVVFSARDDRSSRERALRAGANEFVPKSSVGEIVPIIERIFAEQASE